jgi:hypothetical protein
LNFFLTRGQQNLTPETARGCLAANLGVPGAGTLAAGRRSGYLQFALALAGTVLTLTCGMRFIIWYFQNISRLHSAQLDDPLGILLEVWLAARWSLLGIALFAVGWLWALGSSFSILARAKSSPPLL